MAQHNGKSRRDFHDELEEARKDPKFMREIDAFIKATESVYPLK